VSFLLLAGHSSFSQTAKEKEIIDKMLHANDDIVSAKFTLHTEERMKDGKFMIADRLVKLKTKPKQVYFYSMRPNPGTEIIWKENSPDGKMIVSPGSFPYVTFSMKPNSALARKDSHHSIKSLGFEYVTKLISHYKNLYDEKFYDYVSVKDTISWDNRSCIVIEFEFNDYKAVNYTVKGKETITEIAQKKNLNDYSILVLNPSIDDLDDVKDGQVIKIPNFYSKKIEFYVDRITWLPLKQTIYDGKGLFEKYEMKSFIKNPSFKADEFSEDYKEYKF
jgi:outer membrane lipoprotein-sorting protein